MKKSLISLCLVIFIFMGCATPNNSVSSHETDPTPAETINPSESITETPISTSAITPTISPTIAPTAPPTSTPTIEITASSENEDDLKLGNTSSNLSLVGMVASDHEWNYFNFFTSDHQKGKLVKMIKDGGELITLSEDAPYYINTAGDYLYYIGFNGSNNVTGEIYKIKNDGTLRTQICSLNCRSLTLIGEWLYFINSSDNDTIYRIRSDGSNMQKLCDINCRDLIYQDGYFYCTVYNEHDETYDLYRYDREDFSSPLRFSLNY